MANAEFMSAPCTKTAENKIRSAMHNTDNTTGDTSRIHKRVGSLLGYSPTAIPGKYAAHSATYGIPDNTQQNR